MSATTVVPTEAVPLREGRRRDPASAVFLGLLWLCLATAALFLLFVMIEIITRGCTT